MNSLTTTYFSKISLAQSPQPQRVDVARSMSLTCQPDCVYFGNTKTTPTVGDIDSYTSFNTKDLRTDFEKLTRESIPEALRQFPESIKTELLNEKDIRFSVSNDRHDCVLPKLIHPDETLPHVLKISETYKFNHILIGLRLSLHNMHHKTSWPISTIEESLVALKKYTPSRLKRSQKKHVYASQYIDEIKKIVNRYKEGTEVPENDLYQLMILELSKNLIEEPGAYASYHGPARTILLYDKNSDNNPNQSLFVEHPHYFTHIIGHEFWHAIDELARKKLTINKKDDLSYLSDYPEYLKTLKSEYQAAKKTGLLEKVQDKALDKRLFPKNGIDFVNQREIFVELGMSLTEGKFDAERIKKLYPKTRSWVKHNVLMPYERPAFLKKPFTWLKMTIQMKWYNLKTNIMLWFSKTPKAPETSESQQS